MSNIPASAEGFVFKRLLEDLVLYLQEKNG
jgi:hypothetical protein